MKKTKKTATKKTAPAARPKKATNLSDKDLERVGGGTRRKGISEDGI